jgi:hypothetical protein
MPPDLRNCAWCPCAGWLELLQTASRLPCVGVVGPESPQEYRVSLLHTCPSLCTIPKLFVDIADVSFRHRHAHMGRVQGHFLYSQRFLVTKERVLEIALPQKNVSDVHLRERHIRMSSTEAL